MNRRNIILGICLPLLVFQMSTGQNVSSTNMPNQAAAIADAAPITPMPSNSAEILKLAARMNGLNSPDIQPWHIKVHYDAFDSDGNKKNSGSYEEFWISATKYKRSYVSNSFNQTDFATEHGLYRAGNQEWPGLLEGKIRPVVLEPVPANIRIHDFKLKRSNQSFGSLKLQCIILEPQNSQSFHVVGYPDNARFVHYCLGQQQPVLRFYSQGAGAFDTLYNDIVEFQGRYLARDISVTNEGKPFLTVHVETIEKLTLIPDLSPSSNAIGPITTVKMDIAALQGYIVNRAFPRYPENARLEGIQGEVVVKFTVGKDGKVVSTEAVSGPLLLRDAATDCVRQWRFNPFLLIGQPVEVESTAKIIFTLGG